MALTYASNLNNVSNAESTTNFAGFRHSGGGSPTPQNETNVFVQGNQAVSIKVSGSTRDEGVWYTNVGSVDLTTTANKHVWIWAAMTDMAQLDTISQGGFYIIVGSSTSNWNKYYMNGSDTIDGRFVRYVLDVTKTPSETAATAATLSSVTHIGIGVKAASITGKAENLVLDRIDYGQGAIQVKGDGSAVATWESLFTEDDNVTNKYGIIQKRSGVFFLSGGVIFGGAGTGSSTTFTDKTGAQVVFEDPRYSLGSGDPVTSIDSPNLYKISAQGASGTTTALTLGAVVGSGDDRQGVQGGVISTAGPSWEWDTKTSISELTAIKLYGVTMSGAGEGILLDSGGEGAAKTSAISCTFTNCGKLDPGTLADGAELLSCTFIDPTDSNDANNFALLWPDLGDGGSVIKRLNFITSGTPTTQHGIELNPTPISGQWTTIWDAIKFFGPWLFSGNDLWHGGVTAEEDILISATNLTNANEGDIELIQSGSAITVSNDVTLTVTCVFGDPPAGQANVRVSIHEDNAGVQGAELMNELTSIGGIASTTYNYTADQDIFIRARKGSTGGTKFVPVSTAGTIDGNGFSLQLVLQEDTINET
jgi:hypothetical protein